MNGTLIAHTGISPGSQGSPIAVSGSTAVVGKVPSSETAEFEQVLDAALGGPPAQDESGTSISRIDWSTGFSQLVQGVGQNEARIDRLIRRGLRGRVFSQSELLSMQALVYRYSHQLGVTSKLTEAVTSGARQVLTIQI